MKYSISLLSSLCLLLCFTATGHFVSGQEDGKDASKNKNSVEQAESAQVNKEKGSKESDSTGKSVSLCFVMLKEKKAPTRAEIEAQIKKEFGVPLSEDEADKDEPDNEEKGKGSRGRNGKSKPTNKDSEPDVWSFEFEDTDVFIAYMPGPIPDDEAADAADENFLWKNGRKEASTHKSHLLVTSMRKDKDLIESSLLTTRTARALTFASETIGVYWGNGSISNSTEVFQAFANDASKDDLPLMLWVRFQFVKEKDAVRMYTIGMQQFDKMEIETAASDWKPSEIQEFVYNIADYVITSKATIRDGDTVGGTEEEKITIIYQPSMIDPDRKVMQLQLP